MKNRLRDIFYRAKTNPVLHQSAKSLKPAPTIWGFLGITLFFIFPEIIGFWRGREIANWSHRMTLETPEATGRAFYWLLEKFFEDGGSYLNLSIGIALLIWLVYEWKKS